MKCRHLSFLILFLALGSSLHAYKIITPEPFTVAGKNYLKLQLLAARTDAVPDSAFFDILYNTGSRLRHPLDASLSCTLTLNEFNDGVFFVRALIFHQGMCDTLGSKYDPAGVPVILDRHPTWNETSFNSTHLSASRRDSLFFGEAPHEFNLNNNKLSFASSWDKDSLYFGFKVADAHLNYHSPGHIDLFQAKKFLKTLWNSDCVEIGLDLLHDRTVWKGRDDYELLVDVQGNYIGNRWSAIDSFYANWGGRTRVTVSRSGTLNDNLDMDEGYAVSIAIPWAELDFAPKPGQVIGFDVQLYDKDAALDEAFRSSLSGTNPESNDNTSEWTNLVLMKQKKGMARFLLLLLLPVLMAGLFLFWKKRQGSLPVMDLPAAPSVDEPVIYSDSIKNAILYIEAHYQEPELSRQAIAAHVFLSEKYLSSLFKKEAGINLVTFINQYRIARSIEWLEGTRWPISEIAFKVGFNSLQNFNKNFKSITQKSPTDFRRG